MRLPYSVDPNILPAIIAILAHTGDEARYQRVHPSYKTASTPQEERRYLYSLALFQRVSCSSRRYSRPSTVRSVRKTHRLSSGW